MGESAEAHALAVESCLKSELTNVSKNLDERIVKVETVCADQLNAQVLALQDTIWKKGASRMRDPVGGSTDQVRVEDDPTCDPPFFQAVCCEDAATIGGGGARRKSSPTSAQNAISRGWMSPKKWPPSFVKKGCTEKSLVACFPSESGKLVLSVSHGQSPRRQRSPVATAGLISASSTTQPPPSPLRTRPTPLDTPTTPVTPTCATTTPPFRQLSTGHGCSAGTERSEVVFCGAQSSMQAMQPTATRTPSLCGSVNTSPTAHHSRSVMKPQLHHGWG